MRPALAAVLRQALAEPPARAGKRLISERELARRLGTSHARVHRAIRALVDEGVLVQRRGDGTYIRRTPEADESASPNGLRAADVLRDPAPNESASIASARRLTVGLWWDAPAMMAPIQQRILNGMMGRVEARGHRLALHNIRGTDGALADSTEIADALAAHGSDGYLVPAWRSGEFEAARDRCAAPVLYFGTTLAAPAEAVPHALYDVEGAWLRAVARLENHVVRRILAVHLDPTADAQQAARLRAHACRASVPIRVLAVAPRTATDEVVARVEAELAASEPPDGIVVSDDHLLAPVARAMRERGVLAGRDAAVIGFANAGDELPADARWSRMELDVEAYGALVAGHLLASIEDAEHAPLDLAVRLRWRPGETHAPAL